jgi:hypothetical protein
VTFLPFSKMVKMLVVRVLLMKLCLRNDEEMTTKVLVLGSIHWSWNDPGPEV